MSFKGFFRGILISHFGQETLFVFFVFFLFANLLTWFQVIQTHINDTPL